MKTRLPLVILIAIAAGSLAAAAHTHLAAAHPVGAVERSGCTLVVPGTSAFEVQQALGPAARQLSDRMWIYHNFGAPNQRADDDCSNLVIIFTNDRVSSLNLVNDEAVAVFARQMEAAKSAKLVASAAITN
jgi:hypothetical protein